MEVRMKYYIMMMQWQWDYFNGKSEAYYYFDGYEIEDMNTGEFKFAYLNTMRFKHKKPRFRALDLSRKNNAAPRYTEMIKARSLIMAIASFRQNNFSEANYRSKDNKDMYLPYFLFDERGRRIEIG